MNWLSLIAAGAPLLMGLFGKSAPRPPSPQDMQRQFFQQLWGQMSPGLGGLQSSAMAGANTAAAQIAGQTGRMGGFASPMFGGMSAMANNAGGFAASQAESNLRSQVAQLAMGGAGMPGQARELTRGERMQSTLGSYLSSPDFWNLISKGLQGGGNKPGGGYSQPIGATPRSQR